MLQIIKPPAVKGGFPLTLLRPGARIGTWFCAFLLAILSLAPNEWLLRTNEVLDIGPIPFVEHALAYFLTGIVVAMGYAPRFHRAQMILPLVAYAGLLEFGQFFTPDRSPGIAEFSAGAIGAACGVVIGEKISTWLSEHARSAEI